MQNEDADNLPKHIGDSVDGALLQFVLEIGETYQVWRDEYPEDTLVHKWQSPRGVPPSEEFTAVVIHLKEGGGAGYKLYCMGGVDFVLSRCSNMVLPSLDNKRFDDDDNYKTRKQISDLVKRKPSIEVVCLASKYFPSDGEHFSLDH